MAHRVIGEILTVDEAGRRADMPDDPDEFFQRAVKAFREVNADGEIAKTLMAAGAQPCQTRNPQQCGAQTTTGHGDFHQAGDGERRRRGRRPSAQAIVSMGRFVA